MGPVPIGESDLLRPVRAWAAARGPPRLPKETTMSSTVTNARLGSAPDSWGVWMPDSPKQTTGARYLDPLILPHLMKWQNIHSFHIFQL